MSKPITKLEIITLSSIIMIKYHISLNCTSITTIDLKKGTASHEVKHYGPNKDKIPVFVPTVNLKKVLKSPSEEMKPLTKYTLKMGHLWIVKVPERERLLEGTICRLTKRVVAFNSLDDPPKFYGPYMISQVDFMQQP